MDKKIGIKIPRQSIIYLVVCLSGILVFVFAGILPYQRSITRLDQEISKTRADLSVQEELYPLYMSLTRKAPAKSSSALPIPAKSVLPRSQVDRIPTSVREMAARSGMNVMSVSPDLSTLTGNTQEMPVRIVMRGDFLKFRNFLLGLGAVPYVERVEEIQIQQNPDRMEFRTKIWLVLG